MKIVLTGATGFIGSHWIQKTSLKKSCDLISLSRDELKQNSLLSLLKKHNPKIIVHLASYFTNESSPRTLSPLIESNVHFPTQLFQAARETGCKKILRFGSFYQTYDGHSSDPISLYAATKEAETAIARFYARCGISFLELRLYDTYGPGDSRPKLISLLKQSTDPQYPLELSPGEQWLHLTHIDDVVSAIDVAIQRLENANTPYETFQVPCFEKIQLKSLIQLVESVWEKKLYATLGAKPYREHEIFEPRIPFPELPGYTPKIPLHVGLKILKQ